MNTYLAAFILVVGGLLIWGLRERGRIVEFPFLAGVAFAGFVLPQLVGLTRNAAMLPPAALDRLLLMATLCAAMCWLGYVAAPRKWKGFGWSFDVAQLTTAAWVLLAVGAVCWTLLYSLPEEELNKGGLSGVATAYLFFARLTGYAFVIGLLLYLYRRDRASLVLTALAAFPTVYRAVFLGRRAAAAELAFGVVAAVWLARGKLPPRTVFAPLAVTAMLMASFSVADYRSRALDNEGLSIGEIGSIGWWDNVESVLNSGGPELPNALYMMDLAAEAGEFDYGASAWDFLVFSYVPAQVLGADFKESLYLRWGLDIGAQDEVMAARFGYQRINGTTATGITDSFLSFGYFGCLKFFLIAWVMAQLYGAARRGDFASQVLYTLLVVPAMHSVTHMTLWFFKDWPHLAVFLLPALLWARVRMRRPLVVGTERPQPSYS